jgi:hypothetical protein
MGMSEADLLAEVTAICDETGVWWVHLLDSRKVGGAGGRWAGFPDLFLAGLYGVAFREVKGRRWKLETSQTDWKNRLLAAGADYAIWTEPDLRSGRIRRELEALAGGGPRRDAGPGPIHPATVADLAAQGVSLDDIEADRAFARAMAAPEKDPPGAGAAESSND